VITCRDAPKTAGGLLAGRWCHLPGGFDLVYPSQEILRLSGERIEGVGVRPDVELTAYETVNDGYIRIVALWVFSANLAGGVERMDTH
jgi:C-terminal processing protease CtpA/Prc